MKNSSNKFRGKNNKEPQKYSDFGYYSKNTKSSKKNDRVLNNSDKNKKVENLKKKDEKVLRLSFLLNFSKFLSLRELFKNLEFFSEGFIFFE